MTVTLQASLIDDLTDQPTLGALGPTVQRRVLTGKQCRMLRSKFTEAWSAPGAPAPLPMPLQPMLIAEARARIERSGNKDYLTYYVGQIVGDMNAETSVRSVIQEMLNEFADTFERFEQQLTAD